MSGIVNSRAPHDGDGDGLPTYWEQDMTLNHANGDQDGDGINDGADDFDNDGLTNKLELLAGTHPLDPDGVDDGLPDGWELRYELNPMSATGVDGAAGDEDEDGATNAQEFAANSDPRNARSTPDNPTGNPNNPGGPGGPGGPEDTPNPTFTLTWNAPRVHGDWHQVEPGEQGKKKKDEKDQWASIYHYDGDGQSKTQFWFSVLDDDVPSFGKLPGKCRFPPLSDTRTHQGWFELALGSYRVYKFPHYNHNTGPYTQKDFDFRRARAKSSVKLPQGHKATCLFLQRSYDAPTGPSSEGVTQVVGTYTFTIPKGSDISEPFPLALSYPILYPPDSDEEVRVEYSLMPMEFEVVPESWRAEVPAPNPLAKLSGLSGLGAIPEIEVLPGSAKTMTMECKVHPKLDGVAAGNPAIQAALQKWQLKISQDVIASTGGEFTASNGKWTYSLAKVPCKDGDITDAPIPPAFQDVDDVTEIKASDRPSWAKPLWVDNTGLPMISGGGNAGKLLSGQRDETFIARVYVENGTTHEKQYLKWVKWQATWNVSVTVTANQDGSTIASYTPVGTPTIKKIAEGNGQGSVAPATDEIDPKEEWQPSNP